MKEDLLPFDMEEKEATIIKVIGVGGGGSNAVINMYNEGIKGVDFIICNTDKQALSKSVIEKKIQLGPTLTEGLGAGSIPEKGRESAVESIEEVKAELSGSSKMIFITAGMGGGTGTGAAPVIAEAAHELNKLTVGIVTIPFRYEGKQRIKQAIEGIREMNKYVDALLVVNNEKLREIYGNLDVDEAYKKADNVLTTAAKGIAEIITKEGYVNVDFADVKTVMKNSGIALMGSGQASGEDRAINSVKDALSSPLLDNNDIDGAKNLLINITYSSSNKATMDEIAEINEIVQDAAGNEADLISGSSTDESLKDNIAVTIIATGFGEHDIPALYTDFSFEKPKVEKEDLIVDTNQTENHENDIFETTETDVLDIDTHENETIDLSIDGFLINDQIFESNEPQRSNPQKQSAKTETDVDTMPVFEDSYETKRVINYSDNLYELENTPAYIRQKIELDMKEDYSSDEYSRYTLSTNNKGPVVRKNNQYLHDNSD